MMVWHAANSTETLGPVLNQQWRILANSDSS
jgi:hypothetical protein